MLYKYRTIGNFKNLVDILLNQRLYAACYSELNDPVEGHYHSHLPDPARQVIEDIKLNKQALRICSLSKDPDHPLLWGHYADGRRGVVVGVEVEESDKCILKAIKYKSQLPRISESSSDRDTALKILSHKSSLWKHEGEYRAFLTDADVTPGNLNFIPVKVCRLTLGDRMPPSDKNLIRNLVSLLKYDLQLDGY